MTHFGECADLGISASKCADNLFQSSGEDVSSGFDFGTNTGRALELRLIKSPEELAQKYPDIASKVFPMDQYNNIIAYRPLQNGGKLEEFRDELAAKEEWYLSVPVIQEEIPELPTKGIINSIKEKISNASNNEKLAGVGILAAVLRIF